MIGRFPELLLELSDQLETDLYLDKLGCCTLVMNDTLEVQLEPDRNEKHLIIASFLCEIPPGKFRENTLKDALKANYPYPPEGTLAYSEQNNQLVLFATLPIDSIDGAKLAAFLGGFVEKAEKWKKGVETGQTTSLLPSAKKTTNPFGLSR